MADKLADPEKFIRDVHFGPGVRVDGVYQIPGQHVHDGLRFGPAFIPSQLDRIKDSLELNEKDVVSSGFPKTGSTWVNEIIFLIMNNVDVEKAKSTSMFQKSPFLEMNHPAHPMHMQLDTLEKMPSPRFLKSHLPLRHFQRNIDKLEKGPKIVICMRNPKDNLVSFYHFYKMNPGLGCFDGDWNEWFELFRNEKLTYEPMFVYNATWWAMKHHPNLHFVKYEELKKDPAAIIRGIAEFLGYPLTSDQVDTIVKATSFESMKEAGKGVTFLKGDFFRKGKVGGWHEYFNEEQSAYVDKLCAEIYDPIGLKFTY